MKQRLCITVLGVSMLCLQSVGQTTGETDTAVSPVLEMVVVDDGAHELALPIVLESTLKLPGFHRKPLTRNNNRLGD